MKFPFDCWFTLLVLLYLDNYWLYEFLDIIYNCGEHYKPDSVIIWLEKYIKILLNITKDKKIKERFQWWSSIFGRYMSIISTNIDLILTSTMLNKFNPK